MKNKSVGIILFLFLFVILGKNYISKNLDEIYSFQADYYLKKKNIQKAQEYYEKAFDLGFNKSKQRENYVNSIIYSPLTTEAQEKLFKFVENPKEDVARFNAEYFLSDLKREIHRKYPENFVTNSVYNQKILRWGDSSITYAFKDLDNVPRYFVREIENAFTEWEHATDELITFSENQATPNIIIKFESQNPANSESDVAERKYVVAYTYPILNQDKLLNMEIVFYLNDSRGKAFSSNQVYNTALHEIAHALGFMGHSNDKDNVMYLTKDSVTVLNDIREELTDADINTIKLLYKIKPQITNIKIAKGEYIPNLVLGSEKEVNNEKIKEAKIYIRKAPNLPAGYIDLAEGYVAAKDYNKAIKSLKKALSLAETDDIKGMIYFNLAVTSFYVDDLARAQDYLSKSMQIKDSNEHHYLNAEILVREGKAKEAINEYKKLVKSNPKNIEYVIALTNIYVLNRNFIKARSVLKEFIEQNPEEKNNPRFEPYGILKLGL